MDAPPNNAQMAEWLSGLMELTDQAYDQWKELGKAAAASGDLVEWSQFVTGTTAMKESWAGIEGRLGRHLMCLIRPMFDQMMTPAFAHTIQFLTDAFAGAVDDLARNMADNEGDTPESDSRDS